MIRESEAMAHMVDTKMETVKSQDGTRIAYWRTGAGAPLVLVHGTSADHTRWAPILPALEKRFTVYAVDRRGRGGSGDAAVYSIEREFEDVAAVVNSIGGPVNLLGHSYGAICSLGAALRGANLRRLVLYEPPLPLGNCDIYPPDLVPTMERLLAAGDRAGVVSTFMQTVVRMPAHELDIIRAAPSWQGRLAAAHTLAREIADVGPDFGFTAGALKGVTTPALLLLGGDSPKFFRDAIEYLHDTLPDNHVVVLPGQQHVAINTAPDLFAREVVEFLLR